MPMPCARAIARGSANGENVSLPLDSQQQRGLAVHDISSSGSSSRFIDNIRSPYS